MSDKSALRLLRLLDTYRARDWEERLRAIGDDRHGCFRVPSKDDGKTLKVIISGSEGWDHVSVSREDRTPSWSEMEQIKRLFFRDDALAMQLHVPPAEHKNCHPHCLHIWRPHDAVIPRPPGIFVAP